MYNTNPFFLVKIVRVVPYGSTTYAVRSCPRCGVNIGITDGMLTGDESIICKGSLGVGTCNGHFYLREFMTGNPKLEFVGTVKEGVV